LKFYIKFIYSSVTVYVFQFDSCVCNVQLIAGVELLQYISISVLWFLIVVEGFRMQIWMEQSVVWKELDFLKQ